VPGSNKLLKVNRRKEGEELDEMRKDAYKVYEESFRGKITVAEDPSESSNRLG